MVPAPEAPEEPEGSVERRELEKGESCGPVSENGDRACGAPRWV